MKFLFEAEDCIVGVVVGLVLIGLSGKYFSLPKLDFLWGILFLISLIFTLFDVAHTFTDLSGHPLLLVVLLANNIADFIIEAVLVIKYMGLGITLPYISQYMPLLDAPLTLFVIGIFFIASSIFWLIVFPFM